MAMAGGAFVRFPHKWEVPTELSKVRFQGQLRRHFAHAEFFSV
jgi:hypothetical protein